MIFNKNLHPYLTYILDSLRFDQTNDYNLLIDKVKNDLASIKSFCESTNNALIRDQDGNTILHRILYYLHDNIISDCNLVKTRMTLDAARIIHQADNMALGIINNAGYSGFNLLKMIAISLKNNERNFKGDKKFEKALAEFQEEFNIKKDVESMPLPEKSKKYNWEEDTKFENQEGNITSSVNIFNPVIEFLENAARNSPSPHPSLDSSDGRRSLFEESGARRQRTRSNSF